MTDTLNNLFDSPPGPSRRPAFSPPPRTPTPPSSASRALNQSSEPLFLSPGDTPARPRPNHNHNYADDSPDRPFGASADVPALAPRASASRPASASNGFATEANGVSEARNANGNNPMAFGSIYDPMAPFDPMGGLNVTNEDEPAKKKRKPIPKIDAERLMSERGLPALMKAAKKFKVRGKGHESADLTNLLNVYQIWAHQMFPRGDFMGTMGRVENVLRTRRMESAMKGYREAFYPPPRSPTPQQATEGDFGLTPPPDDDISRHPPSVNNSDHNDGDGRQSSGPPLFEDVDPELEDMIAMEEMEREEAGRTATASKKQSGEEASRGGAARLPGGGDDEGPPMLEEEDEWEGLYD